MDKNNLMNGDFISLNDIFGREYYIYYDSQFICLKTSAAFDFDLLLREQKPENISYLGNYNCTQTFPKKTAQWHQFRQWFWLKYMGRININDEEKIISFIEELVLGEIPQGKKPDSTIKL